jgi:hypothetical protein
LNCYALRIFPLGTLIPKRCRDAEVRGIAAWTDQRTWRTSTFSALEVALGYCTVILAVVECCNDPEVPVTVMVYVPAGSAMAERSPGCRVAFYEKRTDSTKSC